MSHFYGTLQGNRGETTRCGTKGSGVTTHAAGWKGTIRTTVSYDADRDRDVFEVWLEPWKNSGGGRVLIAKGVLDSQKGWDEPPREIKHLDDCSICGNPIDVQPNGWAGGHNAEPINSGRCCSVCNATVVIPARFTRLQCSNADVLRK